MITDKTSSKVIFFMLAMSCALPAMAQKDVRGVKLRDEGLKVIEEKCLTCHNQKRIDAAIKERRQMERILGRMEKKGVVLTEKEHQVMGHFWGQRAFKKETGSPPGK